MSSEVKDRDRKHASRPRIPVAAPNLSGHEADYVLECLSTTWISSNGRFISEFERSFAEFCDVRYAVAVNNGTAALHLALVALGISEGDEVILPTLTYVASANVIRYCNAQPVFADNDLRTFNIDPDAIEELITDRTKAIMPVHLYGHPVDMDPIRNIADRHGLYVLEDAAEAVGAHYKGRKVGGLGHCAAFSFFGNKIITTGEGGMVTTNDAQLAERLRLYRGQGMDPERRYWFPVIGYNYRMTNIAAALGLAQLERVETHLEERKRVARAYDSRLARFEDRLQRPFVENWADHSYWMYTIMLRDSVTKSRDQVMLDLDEEGIETRPVFYPMHVLPPYRTHAAGRFPNANRCAGRGLNLPTHARLTDEDIDAVAHALEQSIR